MGSLSFENPSSASVTWLYGLIILNGADPIFNDLRAIDGSALPDVFCNAVQGPAATGRQTVAIPAGSSTQVELPWPTCAGKLMPPPPGTYTLIVIAETPTATLASVDTAIVSLRS